MGWSNAGWRSDQGGWYKNAVVAGTPPVATPLGSVNSSSGASQTSAAITATLSAGLMLIVTWDCNPGFDVGVMSSVTVSPATGTANQAATIVENVHGGASGESYGIASIVLDGTSSGATFTVTLNYASNPFNGSNISAYSVPSANVLSQTPTGHGNATNASGTTQSLTLATSANGFIIMMGASSNVTSNSGTANGTEAFTTDTNAPASGAQQLSGHASGVATNASSIVTATFTQSGNINMAAAAWR